MTCRYNQWNAYSYNQQTNPTGYPHGSSSSAGAPSPGTSYSQYSDHQSSSQYSYPSSNPTHANDYYPQYGYSAPQTAGTYAEPTGNF